MEQMPTQLETFRLKINGLKRIEEEQQKTVHFKDCNPEELTEEDMAIYVKFEEGELTHDEFNAYRNGLRSSGIMSRKLFAGYIGNKLMGQQARKNDSGKI